MKLRHEWWWFPRRNLSVSVDLSRLLVGFVTAAGYFGLYLGPLSVCYTPTIRVTAR